MSAATPPGPDGCAGHPSTVRPGTALNLGGAFAEYAVTTQHAHREARTTTRTPSPRGSAFPHVGALSEVPSLAPERLPT